MHPMEARSAASDQERRVSPLVVHHDPDSARRDIAAWDAMHRQEKRQERRAHLLFFSLGRLLLAAAFLSTALYKVWHFEPAAARITLHGYKDAKLLLFIAIVTELCGGLLLGLGRWVRFTAAGLIGYLAAITVLLASDLGDELSRAIALGNIGFISGLLMLMAHGSGRSKQRSGQS